MAYDVVPEICQLSKTALTNALLFNFRLKTGHVINVIERKNMRLIKIRGRIVESLVRTRDTTDRMSRRWHSQTTSNRCKRHRTGNRAYNDDWPGSAASCSLKFRIPGDPVDVAITTIGSQEIIVLGSARGKRIPVLRLAGTTVAGQPTVQSTNFAPSGTALMFRRSPRCRANASDVTDFDHRLETNVLLNAKRKVVGRRCVRVAPRAH